MSDQNLSRGIETRMPDERFHRRSIRLPEWDYSRPGSYFVTFGTKWRQPIFGHIADGEMHLNAAGQIADAFVYRIPERFPDIRMDAHVIMPDHVHLLLTIIRKPGDDVIAGDGSVDETVARPVHDDAIIARPIHESGSGVVGPIHESGSGVVGPIHELALRRRPHERNDEREQHRLARRAMLIPKSIGFYRMNTSKRINALHGTPGKRIWQEDYFERVLRHGEHDRIVRYIHENPMRWKGGR